MHTVGVSLKVQGAVTPNNSLVDVDDILYTTVTSEIPLNIRPDRHDGSVLCVTDLVNCCQTPMLGNWFFSDGTLVGNSGGPAYRSNRGQNEVISGRQFYGSVRLFRRYSPPIPDPPFFYCVLPDHSNVLQTLYAYIGAFLMVVLIKYFYVLFHSGFWGQLQR